jgi:hypothetical protein
MAYTQQHSQGHELATIERLLKPDGSLGVMTGMLEGAARFAT